MQIALFGGTNSLNGVSRETWWPLPVDRGMLSLVGSTGAVDCGGGRFGRLRGPSQILTSRFGRGRGNGTAARSATVLCMDGIIG